MCGAEFCRICFPRSTVCPDCAEQTEDDDEEKDTSDFDDITRVGTVVEDDEKDEKEEKDDESTEDITEDDSGCAVGAVTSGVAPLLLVAPFLLLGWKRL